jgi:HAD superfamily hydrolase (TIGR01509 family)
MASPPVLTISRSIATTAFQLGCLPTERFSLHLIAFHGSANLSFMPLRKPLQGVLFDWDGTLINSYHADSQAYLGMFRALGLGWGLKELETHYSPDWYAVYRKAGIGEELWGRANTLWRVHYAKHPSQLITGARGVLRSLGRRHTLGLVTSGDRRRVMRQLRAFELTRTFRARVCGGDTPEKKPHPAPLRMALEKLKLEPEECIYVGDTPEDLEMARAVGMPAVAVLGPFPTEKRLRAAKPEFLLKRLTDLPKLLESLNGKAKRA